MTTKEPDPIEHFVVQVLTRTAATVFGATLFVLDALELAAGLLGRRRTTLTGDEPIPADPEPTPPAEP
jgi:hypothetical protein